MMSFVAGLLSASASTAATVVAEYDAFASISVSIVSATYESSGADAFGALWGWTEDDFGQRNYGTGRSEVPRMEWPGRGGQDAQDYRWNVALAASGYASPSEMSGSSMIAGGPNSVFYYDADYICSQYPVSECPAVERIALELSYDVETRATAEVHDPLTGSASAEVRARLQMGYDSLLIDARGNSAVSGTHRMFIDPNSNVGLSLFIQGVGGSASYEPPPVIPLPPAIPLMGSGVLLLGLMALRRTRPSTGAKG